MTEEVKEIVHIQAKIGEGPCWDAQTKLLYWVDILNNNLHIYDSVTGNNRTLSLNQHIGAVVLRKSGGVALALEHGFHTMDLETEQLTLIEDPELDITINRFNDGKCDAAGRFWAGTMNYLETAPTGSLYCLEPDLSIRKVLKDITVSNGIAWSLDNKIMYYIDSTTKQVAAFDYDLKKGELSNYRVAVTIPENGGLPDGMAADVEGMIWVAQWGGYQVSRWNPFTGELLEVIRLPVAKVSSCAFGGEHMDILYITTASVGLDEQSLLEQPLAGSLFSCKTNVKGVPSYSFNG